MIVLLSVWTFHFVVPFNSWDLDSKTFVGNHDWISQIAMVLWSTILLGCQRWLTSVWNRWVAGVESFQRSDQGDALTLFDPLWDHEVDTMISLKSRPVS